MLYIYIMHWWCTNDSIFFFGGCSWSLRFGLVVWKRLDLFYTTFLVFWFPESEGTRGIRRRTRKTGNFQQKTTCRHPCRSLLQRFYHTRVGRLHLGLLVASIGGMPWWVKSVALGNPPKKITSNHLFFLEFERDQIGFCKFFNRAMWYSNIVI